MNSYKIGDLEVDVGKTAQSLALAFAQSRYASYENECGDDQKRAMELFAEDYFAAVGYYANLNPGYIDELIMRGQM